MGSLGKILSWFKFDKVAENIDVHASWGEYFALFLLLTGFVVALRLENSFLAYVVVALFAFLFGRLYYIKRRCQPLLASFLAVSSFLIGFVAGSFRHSRIMVILTFLSFFGLSYHLHMKEKLVIFKSERFLK